MGFLRRSIAPEEGTFSIFYIETERYASVKLDGKLFQRKIRCDRHGFYIVYQNEKHYLLQA